MRAWEGAVDGRYRDTALQAHERTDENYWRTKLEAGRAGGRGSFLVVRRRHTSSSRLGEGADNLVVRLAPRLALERQDVLVYQKMARRQQDAGAVCRLLI